MPAGCPAAQHVLKGRKWSNRQGFPSDQPLCQAVQTGVVRMKMSDELPVYETELQRIWAEQDLGKHGMQTLDGRPLEVYFPGWWNRGAGPDFEEARVRIGDVLHFGSVEVPLQSSGWTAHRHHQNPEYNQVILHVVLYHQSGLSVCTESLTEVSEFELTPLLKTLEPETRKRSK